MVVLQFGEAVDVPRAWENKMFIMNPVGGFVFTCVGPNLNQRLAISSHDSLSPPLQLELRDIVL